MQKRALSWVLMLSMLFTMVPQISYASENNYCDAYYEFITNQSNKGSYHLFYLNDDDIPELYIMIGSGVGSTDQKMICTYSNGSISTAYLGTGDIKYHEKKNILDHFSYGYKGTDLDQYYTLENGKFLLVGTALNPYDYSGSEFYGKYAWNYSEVTKAEYNSKRESLFPSAGATEVLAYSEDGWFAASEGWMTYDEVLEHLQSNNHPEIQTPENYSFDEDSYSFKNYGVSNISKKYFTTMYEEAPGKLLYKKYHDLGDAGVCFGMAYTTAAIYSGSPDASNFVTEHLFDDDEVCETIRELEKKSSTTIRGNSIKISDYIKYAHIYQLSSAVSSSSSRTWNDLDGLVSLIQTYLQEGRIGVTIGMTHVQMDGNGNPVLDSEGNYITTGHRVLAVGIDGNDILIDDPNNERELERLTVNEDGTWSYSAPWEDDGVNSNNSLIRYQTDVTVPYQVLSTGNGVSNDRANTNDTSTETYITGMDRIDKDCTLLSVDSKNYSISGNKTAVVCYDSAPSVTSAVDNELYWINDNTVTVSELSAQENSVFLAGDDMILGVDSASGSSVTMTVSGNYKGIFLKPSLDKKCSVSFETTADTGEDIVLIVSGSADTVLTAVQTETGISVSGITDASVTLSIDDIVVTKEVLEDVDDGSILIDYDDDSVNNQIQVDYTNSKTNPFTDVTFGKFYYDAVLWAVDNRITTGMTPTTFEPNTTCSRGQVVTFLWRAAGSPEPTSMNNPFTDVVEGKFYYKAVLWAVENGITNGTSETTFSPNDNCTRGQVATFLWRTLGEPKASSTNPFTDVAQGKFYYDAVLWAAESGVTSGMTKTTFAPDATCTRGQIVTFLYRALG